METYIFEGVVTALSSISHNGGEQNGITTQLRREKFVMPNGEVEDVPVISGNSIRGLLRDIGMYHMLQKLGYGIETDGKVEGLSLPAFYFLFSGGALTSTGDKSLNIDYFRKMKETIPLIGLFGGAIGNSIMPGKIKIGKMIPICAETYHIIPDRFKPKKTKSIWDYCQIEMYTRKDDEKNEGLRKMIDGETRKLLADKTKDKTAITNAGPQQMKYQVETLAAGTKFYWKIVLEDVNEIEFEAFLTTLVQFSKQPNIGGKSGTGFGEISIKMDKWIKIDSRVVTSGNEIDFTLGQKYEKHLEEKADEIKKFLEGIE